jgi:hypothetical protein
VIDEILRSDLDAPRTQRHTVKRIYGRLIDEHGMAEVSYQVLRAYLAARQPEIRAESGRGPTTVFVPQSHRPGMEAEVDFGDVAVRLHGQLVTLVLFSLRLSFSGKAVHRIFASGGQEAFFEGHVHAFRVLGGARSTRPVTTSNPRSPKSWDSPGSEWKPSARRRFARTGPSTPSTAGPAYKPRMRRASSKTRPAGSGATTRSRSLL